MPRRDFILSPLGLPIAASLVWDTAQFTIDQIPLPPIFTVLPSITGLAIEGETLTGVDGTVSGGTVTGRQWLSDGDEIEGATSATLLLTSALVGTVITFRNDATGLGGEAEAVSDGVGPIATAPEFSSVNSDGWAVVTASPTDLSFAPVAVTRAGYDATGTAATLPETLLLTKRVRQPFPNQASFTADTVSLSEYVCADDVIPGATNNSTKTSPKPICRWVMPHRMVVGDTIHWELVAFHWAARAGNPVASVHVRATNGTNSTSWQVVSAMSLSTYVEDARPTSVYQGDLDISSLPDNTLVWLEAKVFPHVGVGASVRETVTSDSLREFGRRYFTRNTTIAANPPLVYVASTGNDTTGTVSTDPAVAAAAPCLTISGAINRAHALLPSGLLDGLEVRIVDTVGVGTNPATARNQSSGAITITRAPGTSRAAAIFNFSANMSLRLGGGSLLDPLLTYGAIIYKDMTIVRSGTAQFGAGTSAPLVEAQFWNCSIDNGSVNVRFMAGTGNVISQFGVVWSNVAASVFPYSTGQVQYTLRGVTASLGSGYEGGCTIASTLTAASQPGYADAQLGAVWYNTAFLNPASATAPINIGTASAGQTIDGIAIVQNFIEPLHTTASTPGVRPCSDGGNGNCYHAVVHHNVNLGAGTLGRWNLFYDDAASARFYDFISVKGNICPQINVKGDVFQTDGTRLGNRALIHGVGCRGNFTKYAVNSVATEAQFYPGIASNIGTSTTVLNDPLFVSDQGTTFNGTTYTAGAGGSDVNLATGSPCIGLVDELLLPFDFAGNARTGTQDAGIFA